MRRRRRGSAGQLVSQSVGKRGKKAKKEASKNVYDF
jgi:hypothetical protein